MELRSDAKVPALEATQGRPALDCESCSASIEQVAIVVGYLERATQGNLESMGAETHFGRETGYNRKKAIAGFGWAWESRVGKNQLVRNEQKKRTSPGLSHKQVRGISWNIRRAKEGLAC